MESRVCEVVKIVMQDLQELNREGDLQAWEDGAGHSVRRFHACTFLLLLHRLLFREIGPFILCFLKNPPKMFLFVSGNVGSLIVILFSCFVMHVFVPYSSLFLAQLLVFLPPIISRIHCPFSLRNGVVCFVYSVL